MTRREVIDAIVKATNDKIDESSRFYESPIHVTITPPQIDPGILEGTLLTLTQEYQITVDKEELVKALQYDRDQYSKGFEDGKQFILNRLKEVLASESIKDDLSE